MTVRTYTKSVLLTALIALSAGGLLLHLRVHPLSKNGADIIPFISGILGIVVIPFLFSFRKTISYAYVINGFQVIIGTILMAHFALAHLPDPLTPEGVLLNTPLADIFLLWGKFFAGKALFDLEMFGYDRVNEKKGKSTRYPNLGWWFVHLVAVSVVYSLGNLLWR